MSTPSQELPDPTPAQAVQHFLSLLDDVNVIQQLLLDETERLRARVRELEAGVEPPQVPRAREGGRP